MRRTLPLILALFVLACGEEPLSEDEFLAFANTICANYDSRDSESGLFDALRDVEDRAPERLRDDYERALDKGSLAAAETDFRVMNLDYCAALG